MEKNVSLLLCELGGGRRIVGGGGGVGGLGGGGGGAVGVGGGGRSRNDGEDLPDQLEAFSPQVNKVRPHPPSCSQCRFFAQY